MRPLVRNVEPLRHSLVEQRQVTIGRAQHTAWAHGLARHLRNRLIHQARPKELQTARTINRRARCGHGSWPL